MSDTFKKVYLFVMIAGSFLAYMIYYYYTAYFDKAHYKVTEFEHVEVRFAKGDHLAYAYNSKTGILQFRNEEDSLITKELTLPQEAIQAIHQKMWDIMYFDMPDQMIGGNETETPRYYIDMCYLHKCKSILWDEKASEKPQYMERMRELKKFMELKIEENEHE